MSDYKEKQNAKISIKADRIIAELPSFCRLFFVGRSRKLSDNTKISYANQLLVFFRYLISNNSYFATKGIRNITVEDMSELTVFDIEEFLADLKKPSNPNGQLSDASVEHYIATLSSFYRYMCSHKMLQDNPMIAVEHVKMKDKEVIYLDDNERARYLDTVSTVDPGKSGHVSAKKTRDSVRNIAIIKLFLSTGIRISELVGLDLGDINWTDHSITVVRKGGETDSNVFFSDEAELALKDYLAVRDEYSHTEEETALFLSSRGGGRMSVRGIEDMVKKQTEKAKLGGKKITPHKLRSSFAVHRLNNNGRDIMDVKDALHHKSIQSTLHYLAATDREIMQSNRNL